MFLVGLKVQTKMAKMFVTVKIMPESVEVDLKQLREEIKSAAQKLNIEILDKDVIEPVAFGLKALKLMFLFDESKGSEELLDAISAVEGVSSAEAVDMRRALG